MQITLSKNSTVHFKLLLLCLDFDDIFVHTAIIRQHYVFLVETLDSKHSGLVSELLQENVLSDEEQQSIDTELKCFTQNEKLLSVLSRKTVDQFEKFLDALDKTGQQHIRNHITGRQRQYFAVMFAFIIINRLAQHEIKLK